MKAYLYSPNPDASIADQWDFGFVKDFLDGNMWRTPDWEGFEQQEVAALPKDDKAIVVIPARHNAKYVREIKKNLRNIDRVVLFLMGDEEAVFDVSAIEHPNISIWVQNPHRGKHDFYDRIGTGYPAHARELLQGKPYPDKTLDIFFSGQITHPRREEMKLALDSYAQTHSRILRNYTDSFTSGFASSKYFEQMSLSKIALAPAGAVIPDSFRLFEALECMAVPVADEVNSDGTIMEYWDWLFATVNPVPKITQWDRIYGLLPELLREWPHNMHEITAWWIAYKRNFAYKVMEQLNG